MSKNSKISATAYRVLYLFKLMNNQDLSIENIINSFIYEPYISRDYSSEVILKYINTLKLCGFTISRYNSGEELIYQIERFPNVKDLNQDIIETIVEIEKYMNYLSQDSLKKAFNSFINKLLKYYSKDTTDLINQLKSITNNDSMFNMDKVAEHSDLIKHYNQCCKDQQIVEITYCSANKGPITIALEPRPIEFDNNNFYINGYNTSSNQKESILIDYILNIKQLPTRVQRICNSKKVNFKLTGELSKNYLLYDNDKLIEKNKKDSTIVIETSYTDQDKLFKRLLRYGANCEIIHPIHLRNKFKSQILNIIANYKQESLSLI